MLLTKFFRVAREGDTVDGRSISREQIQQMADNYDRENTYGARIWPEHFRGLVPGSPFDALGDVMALDARDEDGTLALYAQLAPTPQLIEMNRQRQKIYSSIEMATNFAGTGEAYLMGLAVTDSPAVLGTEPLRFSQFASGAPDIVVGPEVEAQLELADEGGDDKGGGEGAGGETGSGERRSTLLQNLSARVSELLGRRRDHELSEVAQSIESMAEHVGSMESELRAELDQLAGRQQASASAEDVSKLAERVQAMETSLDQTPARSEPERPPATGGDGGLKTDC
ncbi:GPO family capsid scaffolding protein [Halorhodospira neutriphila]|uniref:Phage capsid scaffolding n=1 Tax=Halorhodospira neutriphila TaxID=168379 RepID=A0ABS1E1N8_9GAMM|nr:GPO family capsid scaffolding protein [Halorhodospira neutriphila]MBK1725706.1 hypothetical protein [Halorhodospira neutriphila]